MTSGHNEPTILHWVFIVRQLMHPPASLPQHSKSGSNHLLSLGVHSPVSILPLYSFTATADCIIRDLVDRFTQYSDLPGVIVTEGDFIGLLSRRQCLNCLLHTAQIPHFIDSPLRILLNYTQRKPLTVASDASVLSAARSALKRSLEQQSEPILVKSGKDKYQLLDADVLNVAHWQIRGIETQIRYERLQMQILESEKMASLGRLVDGVAHEILDPVSFIWGNLSYIENYVKNQSELLLAYEAALPNPPPEILELQEEIELDYLRSDLPAAVKSARGGAHRLRQLATSLQNFCHIDAVHPRPTDLNLLIDSTLRLLKSRISTPITIEHSYGKLPPVQCFSGQLSQVFMNIFTNTIDSLLSQAQQDDYLSESVLLPDVDPLKITVTTRVFADQPLAVQTPQGSRWVSIIVSDNGPGIPPETKAQILESFSTKSRYRKESGLVMSYRIVTAKHGGKFWLRSVHASDQVSSETGSSGAGLSGAGLSGAKQPTGTEFEILLPLTTAE